MGFPYTIVECAFNNASDETLYATQGWTEVTPWIISMSGSLRGRSNEVERTEAGTLNVTLDNADGNFTPGNPNSPYYPNIKANRRFRVRGKNMVAPNLGRGGGQDRSTVFFDTPTWSLASYTKGVSSPVWKQHDPAAYPALPSELTDHIEVTVNPSADGGGLGYRRILSWLVPVEVGVRLVHSAYIWKVSGTEPGIGSGHNGRFEIFYFDNEDEDLIPKYPTLTRPMDEYLTGTPTTPTRKSFSHAPVGDTKYARVVWSVYFTSTSSGPVTYAVSGIQTELPANLAPNPSAYWDALHWLGRGGSETPVTSSGAVSFTWGGSVSLYQTIPHLIPGRLYAVTAEVNLGTGHPQVMLTADGGATGATTSTIGTWTPLRTFFEAGSPEEVAEFLIPDGTNPAGKVLQVRGLNVQEVSDPSVLLSPEVANPKGETAWERPMDIFEGWVERWPWKVNEDETSITVVDRMKRVGAIALNNVVSETLAQDMPAMVIPMNDDPTSNDGTLTWYGDWAQETNSASLVVTSNKGDLLDASYTLGEEGPTEEPAIQFSPASTNPDIGYYLPIPYTSDYATAPPVVTEPPPSAPPPTTVTTYTKTYYATWSRSYDSDGTTRWDDTPYLYQGCYFCSNNQRALVGFNWSAITSDLSGASITSMYFTVTNAHARWNYGLTLGLGTHVYSSKPSTWSAGSVNESVWKISVGEFEKKSIGIPLATAAFFKSGALKGFAIGPAPSNITDNYGFFYGATQSAKPYITITYKK